MRTKTFELNFGKCKKLFLCFILFSFIFINLLSQDIDLEKTYTISKDAKKGFLGDVKFDPVSGNYTLSYITVAKKKYARFEHYSFDKDFEFVNMEPEELEFDAAKQKYQWWKFKGDYYIEGLYADKKGGSGTFVLRRLRINFNYRWLYGDYKVTYKFLEKVKLRTEEGRKYYYYLDYLDEQTGELFVLCGIKDKNDKESHKKNFVILKINDQMDIVKKYQKTLSEPTEPIFMGCMLSENENVKEMVGIFGKGISNHKYVRLNSKLEEIEDVSFTADPLWTVDFFITNEDEFYFYGPSAEKSYSIIKIKNGQIEYNTTTDKAELKKKLRKPPSQKKDPEYKGKRFFLDDDLITKDNDLLVTGQLIESKFNLATKEIRDVYTNIITFHFDKNGNLKSQYGVDPKENNEYVKMNGTPQVLLEGNNYIYWVIYETRGMGWQYPSIFRIDKNNNSINDPVTLGNKQYFLEYNYPYHESVEDNKLTFFGSDKKGKTIWFCRIRLD